MCAAPALVVYTPLTSFLALSMIPCHPKRFYLAGLIENAKMHSVDFCERTMYHSLPVTTEKATSILDKEA